MKRAILFSGQGSQKVGMGQDFYEQFDSFKNLFDSYPAEKEIAFSGPQEKLNLTKYAQSTLLLFHVGILQLLKQENVPFQATAGLSLGEYGALVAANILDGKTAIDLVQKRAAYMAEACQNNPSTMYAVLGRNPEELIEKLAEFKQAGKTISIANYNCPGQWVISMSEQEETIFTTAMEETSYRLRKLNVEGGFHSVHMQDASEKFSAELEQVDFATPDIDLYLNISGEKYKAEKFSEYLPEQIYMPTQFQTILENMLADGVEEFVEIGQGKTFAGFLKKINKNATYQSIENVEDLKRFLGENT